MKRLERLIKWERISLMTTEPTRREFIQAAAIAVGALIVPAVLRATENRQFWFLQTGTGEVAAQCVRRSWRAEVGSAACGW